METQVERTGEQSVTEVQPALSNNATSMDEGNAEKALSIPSPSSSPRTIHGLSWVLVVIATLFSTFLFSLDNTIVADVQPEIVENFHSLGNLPWMSVAYFLGAAGTNLIWGQLFAQFNTKWLYISGIVLFEAGSALCGGAPNMSALIVGRAICGVGGLGIYMGVLMLLSVTTTPQERPMYVGLIGIAWGTGTVLGPIIGGAFTDSGATWRWAFYINLCIGALFSPVVIFLVPGFDPRVNVPFKKRLAELDFLGAILSTGALTSLVMAITFGGILYPWHSGQTIGMFVTAGVLAILFGLQQALNICTTRDRRLFPVMFLRSRTMVILFLQVASAATAAFTTIYFLPIYFQFVRNDDPLEAGVRLLPFVLVLITIVVANGAIMGATGYYYPWYLLGSAFVVIGGALMFTVDRSSSNGRVYGYSVLVAIGVGSYMQASFSIAQVKVEPHLIPLATGWISLGQMTGGTLGLTIANSVFINLAKNRLMSVLPNVPPSTIKDLIAGVGSAYFDSLDETTKILALNGIVESIKMAFILVISSGGLSFVLSLFMKREKIFLGPPQKS